MTAVPLHLHPLRHELFAQGDALAQAVLHRSARDGKGWAGFIDLEATEAVFRAMAERDDAQGLRAAILNDSHLIVYIVAPMWFCPGKPLLVEQFFMRVGRGSSDDAMEAVKQLARDNGCAAVIMATMLAANDAALGRLYERHGATQHSSQYLMEIA